MIKKILLTCLVSVFILSSCKKSQSGSENPTQDANYKLRAEFLAKLENGKGNWLISSIVTIFYDKNNNVVYTRTDNSKSVYWNFMHLGPINDFKDLEYIVYPNVTPAQFTTSGGWDLTYENGKFYFNNGDKMPFENVMANAFDLVTTDIQPLYYTVGNVTKLADHGKKTLHYEVLP
jgi:hypothetical protein